jgi:site-specific recombinase XerC
MLRSGFGSMQRWEVNDEAATLTHRTPFAGVFWEYLCNHRQASPQTIASYRDTFRLLLQFLKTTAGTEPVSVAFGIIWVLVRFR